MTAMVFGTVLYLIMAQQVLADETLNGCPAGRPWYLPPVEQGYDVSEQYLVLGASAPVSITVCNCSARIPGKPHPYVWINASKHVAGGPAPSPSDVKKLIDEARKNHLTVASDSTNTIVVSRLPSPACTDVQGLSVLVMHDDKTSERIGTYSNPAK
jgi:hypothetical protein